MCGTQDPRDSGLPGAPPTYFKNLDSGPELPGYRQIGREWVTGGFGMGFLGMPNPRPGNWGWGFFIFGKVEKSPGMGIGDLESPKTLSKNSI